MHVKSRKVLFTAVWKGGINRELSKSLQTGARRRVIMAEELELRKKYDFKSNELYCLRNKEARKWESSDSEKNGLSEPA